MLQWRRGSESDKQRREVRHKGPHLLDSINKDRSDCRAERGFFWGGTKNVLEVGNSDGYGQTYKNHGMNTLKEHVNYTSA